MISLTLNVTLRTDAQCPCCRQVLIGNAASFLAGIAFCPSCWPIVTPDELSRLLAWKRDPEASRHWSTDRGLVFFTPDHLFPHRLSASLGHAMSHPAGRRPAAPPEDIPPSRGQHQAHEAPTNVGKSPRTTGLHDDATSHIARP